MTTSISGFLLLILLAVLAPTPIPVPLDGIVIGLIAKGFNPVVVILTTLIGDLIGTFLIFKIGNKSRDFLEEYNQKKKRKDYILADKLFQKYGKYALLLSGVPFLGDALIFLAGFYKVKMSDFLIYFFLGKLLWYSFISFGIFNFLSRYRKFHRFTKFR